MKTRSLSIDGHNVRSVVSLTIVVYSTLTCSLGLFLIMSGILLMSNSLDLFNELLEDAVRDFRQKVVSIPPEFPHNYRHGFINLPYAIGVMSKSISIGLVCFGGFLILSVITSCIAGQMKKWCLCVYTLALMVTTVAIIATWMVSDSIIEGDLVRSLKNYKGLGDQSESGFTWSALMVHQKCCGVHGYKDFHGLENWPPQDLENSDISWTQPDNFLTPIACCKNLVNGVKLGCHLKGSATTANNNMNVGCLKKVVAYLALQERVTGSFLAVLVFLISYCVVLIVRFFIGDKRSDQCLSTIRSSRDEEVVMKEEIEVEGEKEEDAAMESTQASFVLKSSTSV